jgi:hypothetical protein
MHGEVRLNLRVESPIERRPVGPGLPVQALYLLRIGLQAGERVFPPDRAAFGVSGVLILEQTEAQIDLRFERFEVFDFVERSASRSNPLANETAQEAR